MFTIIMSNPGGELDRTTATDGRAAARALIDMVETCGELSDGDSFAIVDEENAKADLTTERQ